MTADHNLSTAGLHFEEDLLSTTPLEAHRRRGPEQLVYFGADHLFTIYFPDRLRPVPPGTDSDLRGSPLSLVTGVLASCCARPEQQALFKNEPQFMSMP